MPPFTDIEVRPNSGTILASWFNLLRTAGANLEAGSGMAPFWVNYTKSHTDFQTAGTTNTSTIVTLAAKQMIHAAIIKHSTAFAGTGITAYTAQIGISGNADKYVQPFDVLQAVSATTAISAQVAPIPEDFTSTKAIIMTATSTGANLSASTAGALDIWLLLSKLA